MAMTHPTTACPKCGEQYGFLHARPRYTRGASGNEDLRWACSVCGYVVITPTADAPHPPLPPANPSLLSDADRGNG